MRRVGQLIGLKPDQIEEYERLHAAVWPEVLAMISACNIRNYSIFRHGELLFAYCQSPHPPRGRSSYPNSTAIRHSAQGVPLWSHRPTHRGQLTSAPFSPNPVE